MLHRHLSDGGASLECVISNGCTLTDVVVRQCRATKERIVPNFGALIQIIYGLKIVAVLEAHVWDFTTGRGQCHFGQVGATLELSTATVIYGQC